jgi:hypothetical protein
MINKELFYMALYVPVIFPDYNLGEAKIDLLS